MTFSTSTTPGRMCPTCGTRISENATRCPVCGTNLTGGGRMIQSGRDQSIELSERAVQGTRMPEITISLPLAIILLTLFVGVGAVMLFLVLRGTGRVAEPTVTPTPLFTLTPTQTLTPLPPTATFTPLPTATPFDYTVQQSDTCSAIAARFEISIGALVLENNLPADCGSLFVGQKLKVPQPTPTASPLPTSTLKSDEATEAACEKTNYLVQENDTLSGIAARYAVPIAAVREYNGLPSDVVYSGMPLVIPLCKRAPTPGPSPTSTPPPPYGAPNLLLPADGAVFSKENTAMSLQWASVGTLRENEAYMVSIEDLTEGEGKKTTYYVRDTKQLIPVDILPKDNLPHVFRWVVGAVRQVGTDEKGEAVYEQAGAQSNARVFIGYGSGSAPVLTPTPE